MANTVTKTQLDPAKYEMFIHRLYNVAEEGRIALQKVTASPIVVQGGECMSAFYNTDGKTIISASGHLSFCAGCADAITKMIEWYEDEPGIFDGDQFFINDPYVCSTHVYDQMIVKPIFHEGKRIAWTGSMTHTADTGGLLRGASTEIFHEGIRILGLKIIEGGQFRKDVFKTLTEQCRDPDYVGLDLKSRIAANNVCAKGFLQLVDKYGLDFVNQAGEKLIEDSEKMARARLRSLPDGTWRSHQYGVSFGKDGRTPKPFRIVCTMTKEGEEILFDCTGTSPQNEDSSNVTMPGSWGQLYVALSSQLFWNIPWNGGMVAPVRLIVPEGTLLNCKFPAACGWAPGIGGMFTAAASQCIAKMLFAAGKLEDVNASWYGTGGSGGPGIWYGGHNQYGSAVGQGIYDFHASGFGAAPYRDGVPSGGHMNNPTIGISDIENIEMNYPMLYCTRNHLCDSGGFGKFNGGQSLQRVIVAYGTNDLTTDYKPYDGVPQGWGLFGGYPIGSTGEKMVFRTKDMPEKLAGGRYPTSISEVIREWGEFDLPRVSALERVQVREYDIIVDPVQSGSGYGDPLDRDPSRVVDDVRNRAVSLEKAKAVYGVVLDPGTLSLDESETEARRREIRDERLKEARPVGSKAASASPGRDKNDAKPIVAIHEYLEVVDASGSKVVRCRKCHSELGKSGENYKIYALCRTKPIRSVLPGNVVVSQPHEVFYREYICPGCATLLEVDLYSPLLDEDEPIWDIQIRL